MSWPSGRLANKAPATPSRLRVGYSGESSPGSFCQQTLFEWRAAIRKKVAIFGGTFDPIHCAHLTVAREAREKFQLDQILFVPASHPPHKLAGPVASFQDRFRMVELACQGEPAFVPSRLEEGEQKSYSIHTVLKVRSQLDPSDRLFFLIGADAFAEIRTWYRWEELIRLVEFIVAARPGHQYQVPGGAVVHHLDTLALPISSSEIRRKLAAGLPVAEVPPAVLEYIYERGLYGARRPAEVGVSGLEGPGRSEEPATALPRHGQDTRITTLPTCERDSK